MHLEIERKFLVKNNVFPRINGTSIQQGFISTDKERLVRIRVKGDEAFLTIKGNAHTLSRPEFEYPIPMQDAEYLLENLCTQPLIEKTRYVTKHGKMKWEIDEFKGENKGLVIAEVEMENEDQQIDLPAWVTVEVTGDPKYYNANLIRYPYSSW